MTVAEKYNGKRMKTGVFMSEDTKEYYVSGMRKTYGAPMNSDTHDKEKVRKEPSRAAKVFRGNTIVRNTAVCAFAVLLVWGIAGAGTGEHDASIKEVVSYEYEEEDIGELTFVSSVVDEAAVAGESATETASAASFVYPLDGIVTTTFAQNGAGAIITAMDTRDVVSSKNGEIYEVAGNYIRVLNSDGSITTYYGVESTRNVGESVQAGNMIGELLSDVLYVEQDVGGKKTDPFA